MVLEFPKLANELVWVECGPRKQHASLVGAKTEKKTKVCEGSFYHVPNLTAFEGIMCVVLLYQAIHTSLKDDSKVKKKANKRTRMLYARSISIYLPKKGMLLSYSIFLLLVWSSKIIMR